MNEECVANYGDAIMRIAKQMKHARQRRLARGKWNALAVLALGLTILGADKSPATRALQRFLSRGRTDAVTSAEIACGYRVTGTDAGGWSVGDITWTIPVVWREPFDFSVSRGYQDLSTERQVFTIDAAGTVFRNNAFRMRIAFASSCADRLIRDRNSDPAALFAGWRLMALWLDDLQLGTAGGGRHRRGRPRLRIGDDGVSYLKGVESTCRPSFARVLWMMS